MTDHLSDYIEKHDFLLQHLKMWKDEGVPAPLNELQSIQTWLSCLGTHGEEETKNRMHNRLLLLMTAAKELHKLGRIAEDAVGIYDNRPDMRP